jgi:U6 snRNA-associated Sm-like protein LSm1
MEDELPLQEVTVEHLLPFYQKENEERKAREAHKAKVLHEDHGFSKEGGEGDGY